MDVAFFLRAKGCQELLHDAVLRFHLILFPAFASKYGLQRTKRAGRFAALNHGCLVQAGFTASGSAEESRRLRHGTLCILHAVHLYTRDMERLPECRATKTGTWHVGLMVGRSSVATVARAVVRMPLKFGRPLLFWSRTISLGGAQRDYRCKNPESKQAPNQPRKFPKLRPSQDVEGHTAQLAQQALPTTSLSPRGSSKLDALRGRWGLRISGPRLCCFIQLQLKVSLQFLRCWFYYGLGRWVL